MSSFLERYKTNKSFEEEGIWVDFGGGVKVRLTRASSNRSREVRRRLERQHARKMRNQDIPPEIMEKLLIEQLAQAIVLDWDGVTDLSGNSVPCDEQHRRQVFTDFPDFREDVMSASLTKETFLDEVREEELGN